MSIGETILRWMDEQDRGLGFLARQCGVDVEPLIALVTGQAAPTDDDLASLAAAMRVEPHDLAKSDEAPVVADVHPLRCYTVREAANLLAVAEHTVRTEMSTGALRYAVAGERAHRIPHAAVARRLSF